MRGCSSYFMRWLFLRLITELLCCYSGRAVLGDHMYKMQSFPK